MDYETPDGSQFSLREIWKDGRTAEDEPSAFAYTSISATVDGKAYFGRLDQRVDDIDEGDVLASLSSVPPEAIYPAFEARFTEAPAFDHYKYYLKAPSFTWSDCQPGVTFVADCLLNEINTLERLQEHHHPNIVSYHGCVVGDGRVTNICLERCERNIVDFFDMQERSAEDLRRLMDDVDAGIAFLHSQGLAHNDINPENICVQDGRAVLVDFDSCMPFGQRLMKGRSVACGDDGCPLSASENDYQGLENVHGFLASLVPEPAPKGRV